MISCTGSYLLGIASSRWTSVLRRYAGRLHRELRITLVGVVQPEKWVFIVGCYNSGTTLLGSLLGSHPDISSLPTEGQFLTKQLPADYELGLPRMWALREDLFRLTERDTSPDAERLKKEWLIRLDRSKPVFLEKSPPNTARTRWLQRHFNNAHFIALVRNGYAVAEGIRRKAEPRHMVGGWPIEMCARQWNRSNEMLLEDAPYLHRLHWVRYEELVQRPLKETQEIFSFLGLGRAAATVNFNRRWNIHERREPIRNLNAENIARLSSEDIRSIGREARPMLERFGYELL